MGLQTSEQPAAEANDERRQRIAGRRGPMHIFTPSSDPEEAMLKKRYPSIRVDLSSLADAPLLDEWRLEPDTAKADGAVLVGVISGDSRFPDGTQISTAPVQAIEDDAEEGWAWCYGTGLLRLGRPLNLAYSRGVSL